MPTANRGHTPLRALLLDADAFNALRKLSIGSASLLETFLRRAKEQVRAVYLTQYVALHELSDLQAEVASWRSQNLLVIESVPSSDLAYRYLRRQRQIDKGEAEAIAWSLKRERQDRPLFVSGDRGALNGARKNKIPSTDLMGLLVELVESGLLTTKEAKAVVEPWSDPGQRIGKPKDYTNFEATFAKRRSRGPYYGP